jgi:hypothetical protein
VYGIKAEHEGVDLIAARRAGSGQGRNPYSLPRPFSRFAIRALPNEGGMMHPPIPRVVKFSTAQGD